MTITLNDPTFCTDGRILDKYPNSSLQIPAHVVRTKVTMPYHQWVMYLNQLTKTK